MMAFNMVHSQKIHILNRFKKILHILAFLMMSVSDSFLRKEAYTAQTMKFSS